MVEYMLAYDKIASGWVRNKSKATNLFTNDHVTHHWCVSSGLHWFI